MSEPTPEVDPAVAQTRLLMADVGDGPYLTDEQVTGYLELNDGDVRMAAADALDAIATSEVLVGKVIRTQDLQTDGARVADALRKHADRLREQSTAGDTVELFDVVYPSRSGRPELTEWQVWGL